MPARPLFRRHDPASQTRYQDLRQLARSQGRVLAGSPGTLKQRTQSGKRYWVREYMRIDGRKVDDYLGAETSLEKARVAELRAEVDLAKALASGSAKLRLFGYQRIERKPAAVLEVFFNRGLTQAGLTLGLHFHHRRRRNLEWPFGRTARLEPREFLALLRQLLRPTQKSAA